MFQRPAPAENTQKFQQIMQILSNSPTTSVNYAKFAPFINSFIVCFRCLTSGRELPKIPANQTKFAQFAHTSRELHELHAFCTKFYPHLVHQFQISDHRQRTPENWSESTRFHAVCPQLPRIM